MNQIYIPLKMKSLVDKKPFTMDGIGMSGNQVLLLKNVLLSLLFEIVDIVSNKYLKKMQ